MSEMMFAMLILVFLLFLGSSLSSFIFFGSVVNLLMLMSIILLLFCYISVENNFLSILLSFTVFFSLLFFSSESSLLFVIMFEISTLPMFFVILLFGSQPELSLAAYYLGFYSLLAGLPLLVCLVSNFHLEGGWLNWSGLGSSILILPFLVKLPSYFFHLWLPQAHVEAPMEGSMILASILLKMGSFGLIRLSLDLKFLVFLVSVVGLLVTPFIAFVQSDVKSLVAYSSIAHMAMLSLSLWCMSLLSFFSGWLIQISHGFVSALMFYMVGSSAHKVGSRLIYFSSSSNIYLIFICCIFNAGGPISLSFLGEVFFFSSLLKESGLAMLMIMLMILIVTLFNLYLFLSMMNKILRVEGETLLLLLWCLNLLVLY